MQALSTVRSATTAGLAATLLAAGLLVAPAAAQLNVTFVGNEGVLLESGGNKVLIDALWAQNDDFWTHLDAAGRAQLGAAQAPFDNVRWALTTHNHPDHVSVFTAVQFLGASPQTQFVAPPQALVGPLATSSQVVRVNPAFQIGSEVLESPGVRIEVFRLEHFDQFGNDFSGVQNFAYLVTMGGVNLLHLGDVDYTAQNFANFDFADRHIDAVVLPTFNTLLSSFNADLIRAAVNPRTVIASHFRAGSLASELGRVGRLFPGAVTFTTPFQSITIDPVPEPAAILLAAACAAAGVPRRRR